MYEKIVLVEGRNDCDSGDDIDRIIMIMLSQCNDLIDAAHKATGGNGTVKVSSVCSRTDKQTQLRIDALNIGLAAFCSDRIAEFIDNDDNFKVKSRSVNESLLLSDGVHRTTHGSSLLSTG